MNNLKLSYLILKYGDITNPDILDEIPIPVIKQAYKEFRGTGYTAAISRTKSLFKEKNEWSGWIHLGELLNRYLVNYYNTTSEEDQDLDQLIDKELGSELTQATIQALDEKIIKQVWYDIGRERSITKEYKKHSQDIKSMRWYLGSKIYTVIFHEQIYNSIRKHLKELYRNNTIDSTIVKSKDYSI